MIFLFSLYNCFLLLRNVWLGYVLKLDILVGDLGWNLFKNKCVIGRKW